MALVVEDPEAGVDDGRDPTIPTGGSQIYKDVSLAPELTEAEKKEVDAISAAYQDVLKDEPRVTRTWEHDIEL